MNATELATVGDPVTLWESIAILPPMIPANNASTTVTADKMKRLRRLGRGGGL